MHYSALGFRYENNTITFPAEILRPIGVGKDKTVHCMYYPTAYSPDSPDEQTNGVENFNENGFMISSVPFSDWPRTVRFTLSLKDMKGAVNAICKIVEDMDCSIGFFRGGVSGSSNFVLNMTVSFTNIKIDYYDPSQSSYDGENGYYSVVQENANKLMQKIKADAKHYLYIGEDTIKLDNGSTFSKKNAERHSEDNSVVYNVCTSLCYFWRLSKELKEVPDNLVQPFQLKFGSNNTLLDPGNNIRSIVARNEIIALNLSGEDVASYAIGARPVYASVDTKDQTIRFRVLRRDARSSLFALQLDWEQATTSTESSREICQGVIRRFTDFFDKHSFSIKQIHSKEYIRDEVVEGRLNTVLDTGSPKEAWRYINLKARNDLREELNNYLSPSSFRVKKDRIRALSLTHLQAAAWHKSDVGMSQNRVKFVISASTANKGYEKARELSERLTQLGYLNEFIPDVLMNPSYSLKSGSSDSCLQVMKEVVTSASLLLVVVGDDYGRIDRKRILDVNNDDLNGFDTAIADEQKAYQIDQQSESQEDFYKIGFYSELEVAMAMAAGIRCVPVAYGMKHMPTWPGTCIFSGHNTAGFVVDSSEIGRQKFESQMEAIYFETILGMSS